MARPSVPSDDDPTVTTRDAARLLGVSISTAQKWVEDGAIESWKTPGGHRRMKRSAVLALLERRTARAAEDVAGYPAELRPQRAPDYPVLPNEASRLRSVARTGLLQGPHVAAFDRITLLAAQVTGAPVALVSVLTAKRQWFKSRYGTRMSETPRAWAFCNHTLMAGRPMTVEDTHEDARFRDHPLVVGEPFIRFYAGCPLHAPDGHAVGTLCVIDGRPRTLDAVQSRALRALAELAEDEIRLHMPVQGRRHALAQGS